MKLSIITVSYNNAVGLRKTIDSVLAQTCSDFEYIVVDGASTDGSKEILEQLQHSKDVGDTAFLLTIISEPDTGIYNAMNKGIRLAKGDYVLFLNSGDYLASPAILRDIVSALPHGVDVCYGNCIQIWQDGHTAYTDYTHHLTGETLFNGTIPHQASLIRRELFNLVGLYSEDLFFGSDWEWWLKAYFDQKCSFEFMDFYVCFFDMTGISTDPRLNQQMSEEREMVLRRTIPQLYDDYQALKQTKATLQQIDKRALQIGMFIITPFRMLQRWWKKCSK